MPAKPARPSSVASFIRAFCADWSAIMSGGLSVALTWAGYYLTADIQKLGFYLAALACVLFSSYRVWAKERRRVIELEEKLSPKISLSFSPDQFGIHETRVNFRPKLAGTNIIGNQIIQCRGTYIRVHAENISENAILECAAFLTKIWKSKDRSIYFPIQIPHSIELMNGVKLDILPRTSVPVDIFQCLDFDGKLQAIGYWPFSLETLFDSPAHFRFEIIVGNKDVTKSIMIEIDWLGQWDKITGREIKN